MAFAENRCHCDTCGDDMKFEFHPHLTKNGQICNGHPRVVNPTPSEAFPKIICLCGSTRFTDEMLVMQWELTKKGFIVLSWCALPESYPVKGPHIGDQEGVKELVDEVHKRKIDLADKVIVLNIGGYIGNSTQSEIDYAEAQGKDIEYVDNPEPEVEPKDPDLMGESQVERDENLERYKEEK